MFALAVLVPSPLSDRQRDWPSCCFTATDYFAITAGFKLVGAVFTINQLGRQAHGTMPGRYIRTWRDLVSISRRPDGRTDERPRFK